jgi:hypothetical protein
MPILAGRVHWMRLQALLTVECVARPPACKALLTMKLRAKTGCGALQLLALEAAPEGPP